MQSSIIRWTSSKFILTNLALEPLRTASLNETKSSWFAFARHCSLKAGLSWNTATEVNLSVQIHSHLLRESWNKIFTKHIFRRLVEWGEKLNLKSLLLQCRRHKRSSSIAPLQDPKVHSELKTAAGRHQFALLPRPSEGQSSKLLLISGGSLLQTPQGPSHRKDRKEPFSKMVWDPAFSPPCRASQPCSATMDTAASLDNRIFKSVSNSYGPEPLTTWRLWKTFECFHVFFHFSFY